MANPRIHLYGVGICDAPDVVVFDGCRIPAYLAWNEMLRRCYGTNRKKCYEGCEVAEEWWLFEAFRNWFEPRHKKGWHLDKDLLVPGNKLYSPNTCAVVPQEINKLALGSPKGYYWNKNKQKYHAQIKENGTTEYLGLFSEEEDAKKAWKKAKLASIDAIKEKLDSIDTRLFAAIRSRYE